MNKLIVACGLYLVNEAIKYSSLSFLTHNCPPSFDDGAKTTLVNDKTSPAYSLTFSGVKANGLLWVITWPKNILLLLIYLL